MNWDAACVIISVFLALCPDTRVTRGGISRAFHSQGERDHSRVKWAFTSPYGNNSHCQRLTLKTARPSRLTDRSMSMHRPSMQCSASESMLGVIHVHKNLTSFSDISFSDAHTHTHSHLDYRAVTDLPMKEPHKPQQTAWTAVKISTSTVQQLHNCECRFCGHSSWMGHGSKPHVFLMIRLSALAHETAPGTQFLTAHLYVA